MSRKRVYELEVRRIHRYCFFPGEPASAESPLVSVIEGVPMDDDLFLRGDPPEFDVDAWDGAHFFCLFDNRASFRKAWRAARRILFFNNFRRIRTGDRIGELGEIAI